MYYCCDKQVMIVYKVRSRAILFHPLSSHAPTDDSVPPWRPQELHADGWKIKTGDDDSDSDDDTF